MTAIQLRGETLDSIFELLGSDENAMTFGLGWCLARAPALLASVADHLDGARPEVTATILLQEHTRENGITDIEVRDPGRIAWIFEAKAGFGLPGEDQLAKYAVRFEALEDEQAERKLIILARSDRRELTLRLRAPTSVAGVPIQVLSWGEVARCVSAAYAMSDRAAKALLSQFQAYLDKVLGMQVLNSNNVYVVSVNREPFGGGQTTFLEVVEKYARYFHPVGDGWPVNPPNYLAFRYDGRLQSIHHVEHYEVITNFDPHFPGTTEGKMRPHFLYHLGAAIRPSHDVRTGQLFRAARIYAHIDLLLTCDTISDAGAKTRERVNAARKN